MHNLHYISLFILYVTVLTSQQTTEFALVIPIETIYILPLLDQNKEMCCYHWIELICFLSIRNHTTKFLWFFSLPTKHNTVVYKPRSIFQLHRHMPHINSSQWHGLIHGLIQYGRDMVWFGLVQISFIHLVWFSMVG